MAFPNEDDRQCGVMCYLAALHNAAALGRQKIQLNDGTSLEYMFCLHCRYFTNNALTMNTHVPKHYKVGLFCVHSKCNFVMNRVELMLQHGSLMHRYGKKNKGTPIKSKRWIGFGHRTASILESSQSQTVFFSFNFVELS